MKISRLSSIAFSIMLMVFAFEAVAADSYAIYQLYKDPIARAAAIERMKAARTATREKLQSGVSFAQTKAYQGWQTGKEFAQRHKKKLGTELLLLAAATLAKMGYNKSQRENIRKISKQTFRLRGVEYDKLPQEVKDRAFAYCDMIQALGSIPALRTQIINMKGKNDVSERVKWATIFDEDLNNIPNLKSALEFFV